nr:immunoglobulin heavy chain junction region [Mus musculus]
CARYYYFDYW